MRVTGLSFQNIPNYVFETKDAEMTLLFRHLFQKVMIQIGMSALVTLINNSGSILCGPHTALELESYIREHESAGRFVYWQLDLYISLETESLNEDAMHRFTRYL